MTKISKQTQTNTQQNLKQISQNLKKYPNVLFAPWTRMISTLNTNYFRPKHELFAPWTWNISTRIISTLNTNYFHRWNVLFVLELWPIPNFGFCPHSFGQPAQGMRSFWGQGRFVLSLFALGDRLQKHCLVSKAFSAIRRCLKGF